MADYGELRPDRPSGQWFPRTSRDFSLNNLERDVRSWWPAHKARGEYDAQQRSLNDLQVPDAYTPGTQGFNPQTNPGSFIRALIDETSKMPVDMEREARSRAELGFPEVATRPKTQGRIEMDARRRQYLEQMLAAYGVPTEPGVEPESWQVLPAEPRMAMMNYATNAGSVRDGQGFRDENNSLRDTVGILGPGAPLHTAATWLMSTPRMVYAKGDEVAGAADPAGAKGNAHQNFLNAWNTFAAPVQSLSGESAKNSAWADARIAQDAMQDPAWNTAAYGVKYAQGPTDANWNPDERAVAEGYMLSRLGSPDTGSGSADDGMQYFMRRGVPRRPARWAGAFTDAMLNPIPPNIGAIAAAARARKLGAAGTALLTEFGPDAAFATAGELGDLYTPQRADQLIPRLANP